MYKHIHQLTSLVEKHLPLIHEKFMENEVMPEMYLTEWILSFMCAYIPINWLCKYFNEFFKHGWNAFYAVCLGIHEFLQPQILQGYDMPSVLVCMKEMKENRESLHCQTQVIEDLPVTIVNEVGYPQFTPQAKGDSSLPSELTMSTANDNFSVIQRTKDEDWRQIFQLYLKYI
jgi:hypothetical protein